MYTFYSQSHGNFKLQNLVEVFRFTTRDTAVFAILHLYCAEILTQIVRITQWKITERKHLYKNKYVSLPTVENIPCHEVKKSTPNYKAERRVFLLYISSRV